MHIFWIILVGFVAGIIARHLLPGPNNPSGFILTTLLGIAGAFVATYLGQHLGWYRLDQAAGFIGATKPRPNAAETAKSPASSWVTMNPTIAAAWQIEPARTV